jgi:NAD(P)-dependent dehydrogenase (short-subunit alcohol dehydrogenase family)
MDTLELGLKGKVAIVTGGSEGLGRAAVERLARSGAQVTTCARRKDILERAVDDIRKATGAEVVAVSADVSTASAGSAVSISCSTTRGRLRAPPSRRLTTRPGRRTST